MSVSPRLLNDSGLHQPLRVITNDRFTITITIRIGAYVEGLGVRYRQCCWAHMWKTLKASAFASAMRALVELDADGLTLRGGSEAATEGGPRAKLSSALSTEYDAAGCDNVEGEVSLPSNCSSLEASCGGIGVEGRGGDEGEDGETHMDMIAYRARIGGGGEARLGALALSMEGSVAVCGW